MNFPPLGIVAITPLGYSLTMVLLLLYSSLPLHAALIWIKKGVKSRTTEGISHTAGLGIAFIGFQLKE